MRNLIIAAAVAAMVPGAAHAAAFANGSFESPGVAGQFTTISNGGTIGPWTVSGDSVDYIGTYWQHAQGNASVDLSGNGAGILSQTFDTVANLAYKVTFSMAGNPENGPALKQLTVATDTGIGVGTGVRTFDTTGKTTAAMGWATKTYFFTATAASTTLSFASNTAGAYGPALDNVVVTAVPEAATWAMMLVGFGAVGGTLRSRKARKLAIA